MSERRSIVPKSDTIKLKTLNQGLKRTRQIETISIMNDGQRSSEDIPVERGQIVTDIKPFTIEQFQKVWLDYTKEISTETILVNTMQSSPIELLDNWKVRVIVTNADQRQRLNEKRDYLLPYLRRTLNNSQVDIEVVESKKESKQTIFSPLDKLNYMVQRNPNIISLYKEFDLEIK